MDFSPFLFEENRNVDLKVVGVIDSGALSVSDGINAFVVCNEKTAGILCGTDSGSYTTAIGSMPETAAGIRKIVVSSYDESMDVLYTVNSPVIFELDSITDVLSVLAKVFLYIGIGFAVFASLMLSNFISTSIAYKKQEIGILRAIGARSNDVLCSLRHCDGNRYGGHKCKSAQKHGDPYNTALVLTASGGAPACYKYRRCLHRLLPAGQKDRREEADRCDKKPLII